MSLKFATVITNGPNENLVVTAAINSDGTLVCARISMSRPESDERLQRLDRAVSTGGRGLHGETANGNTGADGLFSQGSVQVSSKKNLLATVNVSRYCSRLRVDLTMASLGWLKHDLSLHH